MQQEWGCCAGTMALLMSSDNLAFNRYMGKLFNACGKTLPGSCQGGKPLSFKAKVANLKDAWMQADSDNPVLVSEYVGVDVSEAFGVPPEFITVKGTAMANVGTELKINMEFTTQVESDAVKAMFKKAYGSRRASRVSFQSLDFLPEDAKVDPNAAMSVTVDPVIEDGESSVVIADDASVTGVSGSGSVQASMSVLLGALVLVLGLSGFWNPI